jgi:transposase
VEFLRHLLRHIGGNLLVVWDRLPSHRSRLVREFVAEQGGRLELEYLPAYAPELNPVEYLWGYWKQHEMANLCPESLWDLSVHARAAHAAAAPADCGVLETSHPLLVVTILCDPQ